MNLHILTTAEEKKILKKRHEYTSKDIAELATLSSSIDAIVYATIMFLLYQNGREDEQGRMIPIFNALELLIKPIDRFLNEGAHITPETEGGNDEQ
jgi:hypothetical protein